VISLAGFVYGFLAAALIRYLVPAKHLTADNWLAINVGVSWAIQTGENRKKWAGRGGWAP
jgi:hypothetical protein